MNNNEHLLGRTIFFNTCGPVLRPGKTYGKNGKPFPGTYGKVVASKKILILFL